jgi:hypothetical protein
MKHFFKELDISTENKGDEIVISIKGDKDKLVVVEKKLKAMKELCCGDKGEFSCCC